FHLTPFQSGLITFSGTAGALTMKAAARPILKRFGFRTVLTSNAMLGGLLICACALFTMSTPFYVMIPVLLLGGFFRSLQFTSNNALAYAEVSPARMSRATALSAVGQQMALATGVAIGALTVETVMHLNGHPAALAQDFPAGFIAVGVIAMASTAIFAMLPKNAAEDMADRIPAPGQGRDQKVG